MKKVVLTLTLAAFAFAANAQNDDWYGSKAGGFALTFDAKPVINFVGNMFNGTAAQTLDNFEGVDADNMFSGAGNTGFAGMISGKYFVKDEIAVVAGFGWDNVYTTNYTYGTAANNQLTTRTDYARNSNTAFQLFLGGEYRLFAGKRVQPLFGVNFVYAHTNALVRNQDIEGEGNGNYNATTDPVNQIGLMLNAGVEYFLTNQISLGANLDFGFARQWTRHSQDTKPANDPNDNYVRTNTVTNSLFTGNYGANVTLNFYF